MKPDRARIPFGTHDKDSRLDRVLRHVLPDVPLGRIHALLRKGEIRVGGRKRKGSYRIAEGDVLELPRELARRELRAPGTEADAAGAGLPSELAGRVVFENEHVIAIDKPAGMPVHGKAGLLGLLRPYLSAGTSKSLSFSPGPLHRLDRNTSGLILFPKSLPGSQQVSALLRQRRLAKGHLALLSGNLDEPVRWEDELVRDRGRNLTLVAGQSDTEAGGSRHLGNAVTAAAPLLHAQKATLAVVHIETGRTHQIRAQTAAHGHPLIGDRKYGGGPAATYLLHAAVIIVVEPTEVLPGGTLCAPPSAQAVHHLSDVFSRLDLESALSCPVLLEAVRTLVYKSPNRQ